MNEKNIKNLNNKKIMVIPKSNKSQSRHMSNKNKLVPRLRFPEFLNDGEWEFDKLENLFDLQEGYSFSSLDFSSEKKESSVQIIRITDINNRNQNKDKVYIDKRKVEELDIEKYRAQKGDLLLSLTGAAGFNFFIWDSEVAYINQRTMKLIPKKVENSNLKILLEALIHKKINKIGTGQNNNLAKEGLKEVEFPYPKPKEQQKIAACLSSLDELITAEQKKLELLIAHKKGLLQNLFPQEGKTIPRLRFPEFQNDGEWEMKKLGEIGKTINGLNNKKAEDFGTGYPYITYLQVFENSKIDLNKCGLVKIHPNENQNTVQKGDILFTTSSETPNEVGFASVILEEPAEKTYLNSFCFALRPNNNLLIPEFSRYVFRSQFYRNQVNKISQGSTRFNLSKTAFLKISIPIPSLPEQEKIAACLSSLDDLIQAQQQKIDLLQQHKKGLLQNLFPTINEK